MAHGTDRPQRGALTSIMRPDRIPEIQFAPRDALANSGRPPMPPASCGLDLAGRPFWGRDVNDQRQPTQVDEAGAQYLQSVIDAEGVPGDAPPVGALSTLDAMVATWRAPTEAPSDLHGAPSPEPAPAWHLRALRALTADPQSGDAASNAQRLYHARWLGHLLMPDRAEFRPIVTILIPVYNRATLVVEAIESCIAQTWRPLEILVVDDGSTDDLAGALARFGADVRLVRKENGGVSSARNLGIRVAKGDLIHFLDSDNLLMPLSAARKVDGFARIADAELCYNFAELRGHGSEPLVSRSTIKNIDPVYPISVMLGRDPRRGFYVSNVMIPRFTLLNAGWFDEDMRRAEDTRYWLRLALRKTKAIQVAAKLAVRRLSPDSLTASPKPASLNLLVAARTALTCLPDPRFWPVVANCMVVVRWILTRHEDESPITPVNRADLMRLIAALGTLGTGESMTALPLLAQCRHVLAGRIVDTDERMALLRALRTAVHTAALRAAPLTPQDLRHWRDTAVTASANGRLNAFCGLAEKEVGRSAAALPLVDELLRHRTGIPKQRAIPRYLKLRKLAVPRWLALRLCG